jgi:hypothetical protein
MSHIEEKVCGVRSVTNVLQATSISKQERVLMFADLMANARLVGPFPPLLYEYWSQYKKTRDVNLPEIAYELLEDTSGDWNTSKDDEYAWSLMRQQLMEANAKQNVHFRHNTEYTLPVNSHPPPPPPRNAMEEAVDQFLSDKSLL